MRIYCIGRSQMTRKADHIHDGAIYEELVKVERFHVNEASVGCLFTRRAYSGRSSSPQVRLSE